MVVEAAVEALTYIATPEALLFLVLGTVLGLVFGALPGLGGPIAIALLIPITFGFDPRLAFVMMSGAIGGVAFGGSISAILVNVPGTAPNAATLLDGHPLSKEGNANVALGASATASALGAIVGLVFLVAMLPFLTIILRAIGVTEFFAMALFGLVVLAVVTRGSIVTGMIGAALGLLAAFVGFNPVLGGQRYTFGSTYLLDGIDLIPVVIGLFAVGEVFKLYSQNRPIASKPVALGGSVVDGIKSVFQNRKVFFTSSTLGIGIGLIPAVGGTIATFVAYMYTTQTAEDPDTFGTGDIRGVIAAEAANDSKEGGAMVPTVAFGIPGSATWAVMLGALILHGIQPGPGLLVNDLDIVFIIIFSILFSNILTSTIGLLTASKLSKLTNVDPILLSPSILVMSLLGAYTARFMILDVVLAIVLGVFAYLMIKYGISRVAFIIGLVLGPLMENAFHQSLQVSRGSYAIFVSRPLTILIFLLAALSLFYPYLKPRIKEFLQARR